MFYQVQIPISTEVDNLAAQGNFAVIKDLGLYTSNIVHLSFTVAALITFGFLVLGGINWISAGPDQEKLAKAKQRITNAIIGLAVVAVSWAVFLILNNFFGLNIAEGGTGGGSNNLSSGGSNSGGSSNSSQTCSPGHCECYNNMGCVPSGTLGPISPGGTCYTCNNGTWGSPTYPPDHNNCDYAINCQPYP